MADKPINANTVDQHLQEKKPAVHMCEKKRRHLQKDEKRVQLGLYAFAKIL